MGSFSFSFSAIAWPLWSALFLANFDLLSLLCNKSQRRENFIIKLLLIIKSDPKFNVAKSR